MATSISGADLTVSIIEKITFNGRDEGGTTTVTRSTTNQIKDLFRRVIAVKGTLKQFYLLQMQHLQQVLSLTIIIFNI